MYVSLRLIQHFFFYFYQIELNFKLFRQLPNFNLPSPEYINMQYTYFNLFRQSNIKK